MSAGLEYFRPRHRNAFSREPETLRLRFKEKKADDGNRKNPDRSGPVFGSCALSGGRAGPV
jgi:hypothetical protein